VATKELIVKTLRIDPLDPDEQDAHTLILALRISLSYACGAGFISMGTYEALLEQNDPMKRLVDVSGPPRKMREETFMAARKKPKNYGQQFFGEVEKAVDMSYTGRPRGMPNIEVLKTEVQRKGLPPTDAEYLYDRWLANGFRIGRDPIKDWKAVVRNWYTDGWFPSQNGIKPGPKQESYASHERVQSWCATHKVTKMTARAWGELMSGKWQGKTITNETDFNAAMEVIKARWLKEP
jgi:hypothetical protein